MSSVQTVESIKQRLLRKADATDERYQHERFNSSDFGYIALNGFAEGLREAAAVCDRVLQGEKEPDED